MASCDNDTKQWNKGASMSDDKYRWWAKSTPDGLKYRLMRFDAYDNAWETPPMKYADAVLHEAKRAGSLVAASARIARDVPEWREPRNAWGYSTDDERADPYDLEDGDVMTLADVAEVRGVFALLDAGALVPRAVGDDFGGGNTAFDVCTKSGELAGWHIVVFIDGSSWDYIDSIVRQSDGKRWEFGQMPNSIEDWVPKDKSAWGIE